MTIKQVSDFLASLDVKAKILIMMLLSAMIALCNVVPHGQSPDEKAHMLRAASLANGHIILKQDGGIVGDKIDTGLIQYYSNVGSLAFNYDKKATNFSDYKNIRFTGEKKSISFANTAIYFPLIYSPQAIAIFIGEQLHMKVSTTVTLARLFCFTSVIIILTLAAKLWALPITTSIMLLMPMSIFQSISSTCDGINFSLICLIISLFLNTNSKFNAKKVILLLGLIFILSTHRFNLTPLFILPIFLSIKNKHTKLAIISFISLFAALFWIAYASSSLSVLKTEVNAAATPPTIDVIKYYITHPFVIIQALFHTFTNINRVGFYAYSFVGILGWLDYRINIYFVAISLIILFSLFARFSYNQIRSKDKTFILLTLVSVLSLLFTFGIALISLSEFPCFGAIVGVQGRYLIPVMIIFGYAIEQTSTHQQLMTKNTNKIGMFLLLYGICSIIITQTASMHRYWLY